MKEIITPSESVEPGENPFLKSSSFHDDDM